MVKESKRHLRLHRANLDAIIGHSPVHDVLPPRQIAVPLLELDIGGVVSLDHLLQGHRQLLPAVLGLPAQLLDGGVDMNRVLGRGVNIDNLLRPAAAVQFL